MDDNTYLDKLLAFQTLADNSEELKALQAHRAHVESILRAALGEAKPTIRYGGSKAKGTLIKESYDLDIVCYFPNGEDGAGGTLKEIFENVGKALSEEYAVVPKTSALRLHSRDSGWTDFHVDVVPGRFTDDDKADCYLFQNGGDKDRLKTNLDVHIAHIRDAGVTPSLRILKLWRFRQGLQIKNFVWELLCIRLLADVKTKDLATQARHVLSKIAESDDAIVVEDPANPHGNDVMPFLRSVWPELQAAAKHTLERLDRSGWEGVFGVLPASPAATITSRLTTAAAAVVQPTRPWCP